ncbi:hypothetical protein CK203_055266 [Vitis vinifera]|uniref:Retrotransposon gag domain-containing protein n=1 Tax=Vitis vinifera TaxID=29760 RepID=A0A438GTZ2_VITVI|nr:hypothetical protein CK203_055266 [Vitis vinifera]
MLSTPFNLHIISYEPPKGFLVPKFIMVFPANLHGSALSWFHRLPQNSINSFHDVSKAFVSHYLCSTRQKKNISTLQNIKMQENKLLRDFMKRFSQVVLQVEFYSMDSILHIFKRRISPGLSFFESLAKKSPSSMDDLFRQMDKSNCKTWGALWDPLYKVVWLDKLFRRPPSTLWPNDPKAE